MPSAREHSNIIGRDETRRADQVRDHEEVPPPAVPFEFVGNPGRAFASIVEGDKNRGSASPIFGARLYRNEWKRFKCIKMNTELSPAEGIECPLLKLPLGENIMVHN